MVGRPGLLSDRDDLEALFDELSVELRRLGIAVEVVMVGVGGCCGTHGVSRR